MRRKLYSSRKVSKTALVYVAEDRKKIEEERKEAHIYVFPHLFRIKALIEKYQMAT